MISFFLSHKENDESKLLKCGLEVHFAEQKLALEKFHTTIFFLRVQGKKSLMAWQKGVLTSTTAILRIFDTLKEKFGIRYILTARFNQVSAHLYFKKRVHSKCINFLFRAVLT